MSNQEEFHKKVIEFFTYPGPVEGMHASPLEHLASHFNAAVDAHKAGDAETLMKELAVASMEFGEVEIKFETWLRKNLIPDVLTAIEAELKARGLTIAGEPDPSYNPPGYL